MSISQKVSGSNTTVTLSYTATTEKVVNTLTDAAKYLFNHGFTYGVVVDNVDDLTNAQIGTIIDGQVKKILQQYAQAYNVETAEETAQTTVISESSTKYL